MTTTASQTTTRVTHVFDEVHISRGARPVAQHGHVIVDDGVLTLLGTRGALIERAPMHRVRAARVRFSGGKTLALHIDGTRYNVSPGWGDRAGRLFRPGRPGEVERAVDLLLALVAEEGGQVAA
jgi:hypothetical protein